MPILQKIVISNFRNIEFQELEFSPKINCIWGNNGEERPIFSMPYGIFQ